MAGAPTITPALVVGALRYGDTSRIVRLVTRDHGLVSAIAKGALRPKSRFGAALQLLSEGQAHLLPSRGELHTLTAFDLTSLHAGLASDLRRFLAASALAELAARFVPADPNPVLFDQLRDGLALLELTPPEAADVVGLRVLWRLVADLGLAPSLHGCARDGEPVDGDPVAFSFRDGGVLCARCAHAGAVTRLAAEDLAALVALAEGTADLPWLDVRHAAAHRRLLARWIRSHLAEVELPALAAWERGLETPTA